MKKLDLRSIRIAVMLVGLTLGVSGLTMAAVDALDNAADAEAAEATYTWSAELATFDRETNTVTVRSRLVETPAPDLSALRQGDHAMLTWSGISTAAGIRAIERGSVSSFDRMTMLVEYVSSDPDGRYVSFKVPIPPKDSETVARLSSGAWVTVTSPLRAKSLKEAVVAIRPYTDVR